MQSKRSEWMEHNEDRWALRKAGDWVFSSVLSLGWGSLITIPPQLSHICISLFSAHRSWPPQFSSPLFPMVHQFSSLFTQTLSPCLPPPPPSLTLTFNSTHSLLTRSSLSFSHFLPSIFVMASDKLKQRSRYQTINQCEIEQWNRTTGWSSQLLKSCSSQAYYLCPKSLWCIFRARDTAHKKDETEYKKKESTNSINTHLFRILTERGDTLWLCLRALSLFSYHQDPHVPVKLNNSLWYFLDEHILWKDWTQAWRNKGEEKVNK